MARGHRAVSLKVVRPVSAAIAFLAGTLTGPAAADLLLPASAADVRAAAGRDSFPRRLVARSRLVRIDRQELARRAAPLGIDTAPDRIASAEALEGVITMRLFGDVRATFRRTDIEAAGDSGYAWTGVVDGNPLHYATLIVDRGEITGHVHLLRRVFRIEPVGGGLHRVSELIPSRAGREHAVARKRVRSAAPQLHRNAATIEPHAGEKTIIKILAVYTAAALAENANLANDIKLAISLANTGFKNSKVPIKFERVKTMSAGDYVEAGDSLADFETDLANLGGDNDPETLLAVRKKRNKLKADFVTMFRADAPGVCGVANFTDTPGRIYRDFAFQVMDWTCIPFYTFHHEAGHSMGLRHDRAAESEPGVGYNFGYVNTTSGCFIRTVMATTVACSICDRLNFFSTQAVMVDVEGTMCQIGIAKGEANAADNAKRLKEVRGKIANYRKDPAATGVPTALVDAR